MKKKDVIILVIVIVILSILGVSGFLYYSNLKRNSAVEPLKNACINSGGIIDTKVCCRSTSDFPNNCVTGACGCNPNSIYSHKVNVCNCPENMCFNGIKCVPFTGS